MRILRVIPVIVFLVTAGAAPFLEPGLIASQAQASQFVGTTPCGEAVRAFLGGLAENARCHAITWRLSFIDNRWTLAATYGVPAPTNPNAMVDGPRVDLDGRLTATSDGHRLERPTGGSVTFRRISDALIHFTSGNQLMTGTAGWSYTLNRADRTEKTVDPSIAPDMSYSISPRASGSSLFALFEGRTPCTGIATELGMQPVPGCLKVKWRVTLLKDPANGQPTTYKVESTLHRQQAREGAWRIQRGAGGVVYQLDAAAGEAPILLLQGDDNVLFFLNQQRQMLVGNLDFSYTLNRDTLRR